MKPVVVTLSLCASSPRAAAWERTLSRKEKGVLLPVIVAIGWTKIRVKPFSYVARPNTSRTGNRPRASGGVGRDNISAAGLRIAVPRFVTFCSTTARHHRA